jgi:hypothetical protein
MIDVMDERQITTRTTKIAEASAPCRTSKKLINRLEIIGGKDHFPADRSAATAALTAFPSLRTAAQENRAFLRRAAAWLASQGYRQFLDIGPGLPASPNLHEVVQNIAPDACVLYADNDPIVLAHARALLTSSPQGQISYLDADIRDPDRILSSAELQTTFDLTKPVVLSIVAVLHFLHDDDGSPYEMVARLLGGLPAGSALMLSHITGDHDPTRIDALVAAYKHAGIAVQPRSASEIARFFGDLTLVAPGLVSCQRWHPEAPAEQWPTDAEVSCYGGVALPPARHTTTEEG